MKDISLLTVLKKSPDGVKLYQEHIEAWFRKHIHNSLLSEDTRSYNLLHAAKEDLKSIAPAEPDDL